MGSQIQEDLNKTRNVSTSYVLSMHETFSCPRKMSECLRYIADFSRIDEWDHTIVSATKTTDGEVGLGTKFELIYKMGPRRIPIHYEITQYNFPHYAELTGKAENFVAIDRVTLSEHLVGENAHCNVDWQAEITFNESAGRIAKWFEKPIQAAGAKSVRNLAKGLQDDFQVPELSALAKLGNKLVFPGLAMFSKYGYRRAKKRWLPVTNDVSGKHAVITGATSGIGLESAYQLAHLGMDLTLVARNEAKAKELVDNIILKTGNKNISYQIGDLSLIEDVKDVADRLLENGKPIDVLVNNAGFLFNPRGETSEGLEQSFALLLLSPYVLTERVDSLLAEGSRVINISSGGMYSRKLDPTDLESKHGEYSGSAAYALCKRALVVMTERWAKRWQDKGIIVHSMHPGWALTPAIETALPGFTKFMRRILRSPAEGADTIIWLATASEAAKCNGLFWLDRFPQPTHLMKKTQESQADRDALEVKLKEYQGN